MKLRIRDNSVRIRLTQSEVARLEGRGDAGRLSAKLLANAGLAAVPILKYGNADEGLITEAVELEADCEFVGFIIAGWEFWNG